MDDAIAVAAKAAIDAGDVGRARALLDLLDGSAKPRADVVDLTPRLRPRGGRA